MSKKINHVSRPLEVLKAIDKLLTVYKKQNQNKEYTIGYSAITGDPCPLCLLYSNQGKCDKCLWMIYEKKRCVGLSGLSTHYGPVSPPTNIKRLNKWRRRINAQIRRNKNEGKRT